MTRRTVAMAALTLVATVVLPLGAASASLAAQADLNAFCQARLDLSGAIAQEDNDAVDLAAAALQAAAPPEVQQVSSTLADVLTQKGHKGIDSKKGRNAAAAIDDYVLGSCGFPPTKATAIDYEYRGVPGTLPAGGRVFDLVNDAPKETHELVLAKVKPGVGLSPKRLVALSGKRAAQKLEPVGVVIADPGERASMVVTLTAGRYVFACFVPIGGEPSMQEHDEHGSAGGDAKPHWKKGMLGTFEVTGAP